MMFNLIPDTPEGRRFEVIRPLIGEGEREAITLKDLSKLLGFSIWDTKKIILDARLKGCLICSSEKGYYFPADILELSDYVTRRTTVITTSCDALEVFKKRLDQMRAEDQTDEN